MWDHGKRGALKIYDHLNKVFWKSSRTTSAPYKITIKPRTVSRLS